MRFLAYSGVALATCMTSLAGADAVTYAKDVAPILMENCVRCHRPGEVAPMSLLTYEETRPWAKSIRQVVANNEMPPWHADPRYGEWANDISLSESERETLLAWIDQGAQRGAPADLPPPPEFDDDWELGTPDYVVDLPAIELPADGDDIFPTYVVELDLPASQWVEAIEFRPGDRRVVHHVLTMLGDAQMGDSEYDQRNTDRGRGTTELFVVWVAGAQPTVYPEGMGRTLLPNQVMTFMMHYHLCGEATTDRTRVGLHFGEGDMEKRIVTNFGVNLGIVIPPGEPNYTASAYHLFDQDSRILSFMPHMHVRGKSATYTAKYPDGREEILLHVPRYNYNWQWIYYPKDELIVPAGTRVEVTMAYDNSAENEENPDPGATVFYRDETFSEMFVGFMESVAVEGVRPRAEPPLKKLATLLADHPADQSYLNGGLMGLPWGLYLPDDGDGGKYYMTLGSLMFTSDIWDLQWDGDTFEFQSTMVTTGGGGTSMRVEGTRASDGAIEGTVYLGEMEHADNPNTPITTLTFDGKSLAS